MGTSRGMQMQPLSSIVALLMLGALCQGRLTCPKYGEVATDEAAHLDPVRYQGYWYEVYSHNVFLVDACQCTRYNFTVQTNNTFTDIFTCHKNSPSADPYVINNKGSWDPDTPGKMVESLGPASPPYWVLKYWGDYEYALVYACVGSPLLGEYTYFFSRVPTIPDEVYANMTAYAKENDISVSSVTKVPMDGCTWS